MSLDREGVAAGHAVKISLSQRRRGTEGCGTGCDSNPTQTKFTPPKPLLPFVPWQFKDLEGIRREATAFCSSSPQPKLSNLPERLPSGLFPATVLP